MPRPRNQSKQTRLLVGALLERPTEWRYGYDLFKQTSLQSGTLYPILMRLAEQGLLEETWLPSDTPGRPPRHAYRLTPTGLAAARDLVRNRGRGLARLRLAEESSS